MKYLSWKMDWLITVTIYLSSLENTVKWKNNRMLQMKDPRLTMRSKSFSRYFSSYSEPRKF